MLKRILTVCSIALISTGAFAQTMTLDKVQQLVNSIAPGIKVESVKPAPLKGFSQVVVNGTNVYLSDDGRYFFSGELLEIQETKILNLTNGTVAFNIQR